MVKMIVYRDYELEEVKKMEVQRWDENKIYEQVSANV